MLFHFGAKRVSATICLPEDSTRLVKFGTVLAELGAVMADHYETELGINHWTYRVGRAQLEVFADSQSIDVEGPEKIVERITAAMQKS